VCGNAKWKVYMNPNNGAWICFRCDARGRVQVEKNSNMLAEKFKPQQAHEWAEMQLPAYVPLSRTARKYLTDRGIHHPEKFGIVELKEGPRVLIPYRGPEGKVIYWTTRRFMDDGLPKYVTATGRKPFYVLPRWSGQEDVTFVEGCLDAIVYWLATASPVVAIGGKSISSYNRRDLVHLAPNTRRIILDSDATAQALRLGREFNMSVKVLPPGMDPADYYKGRIRDE